MNVMHYTLGIKYSFLNIFIRTVPNANDDRKIWLIF